MSGSAFLPNFNSYVPFGLGNAWLTNGADFGYLLIEHVDAFENERFTLTKAVTGTENNTIVFASSGFTVYSPKLATPDSTNNSE